MPLNIFSCAYLPSLYLLSGVSFEIFCPAFHWAVFLLLSFENSLYIWIQILFQIFAIGFLCSCGDLQLVFSQSLALLFILFHSFNIIAFFKEQKCLILIKSISCFFSFFVLYWNGKFSFNKFLFYESGKKQLSDGNVLIKLTLGEGVNFIIFWKSGAN